jgi:hypothetical protein
MGKFIYLSRGFKQFDQQLRFSAGSTVFWSVKIANTVGTLAWSHLDFYTIIIYNDKKNII